MSNNSKKLQILIDKLSEYYNLIFVNYSYNPPIYTLNFNSYYDDSNQISFYFTGNITITNGTEMGFLLNSNNSYIIRDSKLVLGDSDYPIHFVYNSKKFCVKLKYFDETSVGTNFNNNDFNFCGATNIGHIHNFLCICKRIFIKKNFTCKNARKC